MVHCSNRGNLSYDEVSSVYYQPTKIVVVDHSKQLPLLPIEAPEEVTVWLLPLFSLNLHGGNN